MKKTAIPDHTEGVKTDTVSEIKFNTEQEAQIHYTTVKKRFLAINSWHNIAGKASAQFTLTDTNGCPVERLPQVGDHFRIGIPAPENEAGEGFDWVQVKNTEEQNEAHYQLMMITVQPAGNPLNTDIEKAHFFNSKASSTFLVKREVNIVKAAVHGRNEKPNIEDTGIKDTIRNAIVATGAVLGFAKIQWKALVKALVALPDD